MGWFGLFDLLRFRPGASTQEGWPLPNSQLRLTDPDLCALYYGAVGDIGHGFHADVHDLASHHLSRSVMPKPGAWHIDVRETGRAEGLLFGADRGHAIMSWHADSGIASIRLADAVDTVTLHHASLDSLLRQTLPISHIATLSIWVDDASSFERLMKVVDPWLTTHTRAIVRMPATALPDVVARLPDWPTRCAAMLPCTRAPDRMGCGEVAADILICLEDLALQTPEQAMARRFEAVLQSETWNDRDRSWREAAQGGVSMRMPLPSTSLRAGLAIGLLGDVPATVSGSAIAAMQTVPYRARPGFDYVLDIVAASVFTEKDTLFIAPQTGPVVIDPSRFRAPDRSTIADSACTFAAGAAAVLDRCGVRTGSSFTYKRTQPIHTMADRVTFLLGTAGQDALEFVTEILPNLEYLFQICERERWALSDIDVLVPGGGASWLHDALSLAGILPAHVRTDTDGVVFRRLLLASPASDRMQAQRSAAYDQFWMRLAINRRQSGFTSFSRPRQSGRIMLCDSALSPLVNGFGLEVIARDRGYQVITPRTHGLSALQELLGGARVVVGPGHLLGWACLAQGSSLGMLLADSDPALPHAALHAAASRGHTILATFGRTIGTEGRAGFVVAPDRFMAILDRIEAASVARQDKMETTK